MGGKLTIRSDQKLARADPLVQRSQLGSAMGGREIEIVTFQLLGGLFRVQSTLERNTCLANDASCQERHRSTAMIEDQIDLGELLSRAGQEHICDGARSIETVLNARCREVGKLHFWCGCHWVHNASGASAIQFFENGIQKFMAKVSASVACVQAYAIELEHI